jgi:hypothetical protein
MSSLTKANSKIPQGLPQNSNSATKTAAATVKSTESSSIAADKSFAAPTPTRQEPPVNFSRAFKYFGGIAEGHYTEF